MLVGSPRSEPALTINVAASEDDLRAVRLSPRFAVFTAVAHVLDGFVASSLSGLKVLDFVAHLDDHAGSLDQINSVVLVILLALTS